MLENLNIESEKKFIGFLGYSIVGPDKSNRWTILDKEEDEVGFIQYKKLHKKSRKNAAIYGYIMNIDSKLLSYERKRNELSAGNTFEFDYNGNHINIEMGKSPDLMIWSKEYGFMDFRLNGDSLFLNFKSETENHHIEETIVVKKDSVYEYDYNKNKEYIYVVSSCDKNKSLDGKDVKTLEIEFEHNPIYHEENQINITEKIWKNNNLLDKKEIENVDGTIREAIEKHQLGIDAFSHFRYIVSEILPFNEDVIGYILKERGLDEEEFKLFIPDFQKDEEKTLTLNKS